MLDLPLDIINKTSASMPNGIPINIIRYSLLVFDYSNQNKRKSSFMIEYFEDLV